MWNVDSMIIVTVFVSIHELIVKSLDQHFGKLDQVSGTEGSPPRHGPYSEEIFVIGALTTGFLVSRI